MIVLLATLPLLLPLSTGYNHHHLPHTPFTIPAEELYRSDDRRGVLQVTLQQQQERRKVATAAMPELDAKKYQQEPQKIGQDITMNNNHIYTLEQLIIWIC